jgi:hypothetical protein
MDRGLLYSPLHWVAFGDLMHSVELDLGLLRGLMLFFDLVCMLDVLYLGTDGCGLCIKGIDANPEVT